MSATASQMLADRWAREMAGAPAPEGPDWLRRLHHGAVAAFTEHGLPHRKVEAWKYTPLKRLEAAAPALPGAQPARGPVDWAEPLLADAAMTVDVVDGILPEALPPAPDGVEVLPFAAALERFGEHIRQLAGKPDLGSPAQAFTALNTAFIRRGLVVHVGAGVDAGSILLRWGASEAGAGKLAPFRLFLLLEEGARLELVEQHPDGHAATLNLVVQARLGARTECTHLRVQDQAEEAVLLTSTLVEQAGESRYRYRGFDLGGGLVRHEIVAELAGSGAQTDLAGACVLDGSRHGDTHVAVDHAAPGCGSEQFFRYVLGGRSRGVYNGRALIREGADGSSVQQSNANLLLSPLAEMDTKPELEIYADEVEASHGATVGQLDESAVFYLRSRGLSETEARRLLTAAFCHAVTSRLENEVLAEKIGQMVDAAMPGAI